MIVSENILSVLSDLPVKPPPDVLGVSLWDADKVWTKLEEQGGLGGKEGRDGDGDWDGDGDGDGDGGNTQGLLDVSA